MGSGSKLGGPLVAAAVAVLASGCGGRVIESEPLAAAGTSEIAAGGSVSDNGGARGSAGQSSNAGGGTLDAGMGCACPNALTSCPPGYTLATQPGQCCPGCMQATSVDCAQGRANYQAFEASEAKQLNVCTTGDDCALAVEDNACASTCGIPVASSATDILSHTLELYAAKNCSTCPTPPGAVCPTGMHLRCSLGQCISTPPVP